MAWSKTKEYLYNTLYMVAWSKTKGAETESKETNLKLFSAAIDFGTTFSGWAYSSNSEKDRVHVKSWNSGTNISLKAPTTVLIKPDGKTIKAFGYDAENEYGDLFDKEEHTGYYYFQQFKMLLYDNKTLTRNEELQDTSGKRLPAKIVFSLVIKYLKDDLLKAINKTLINNVTEGDIQWVLTVPALWNYRAKQFMRECANKAGIESKYLKVALEPEAASLYCKQLEISKKREQTTSSEQFLSFFTPGSQYVIVDAGGGTVDFVNHKVRDDGSLEEISAPNGGSWGGTCIDKAFMDLMYDIYTSDVVQKLKTDYVDDHTDLLREIEIRKRKVKPSDKSKLKLKVPCTLNEIYNSKNEDSVHDNISRNHKLNGRIVLKSDKLMIDQEIIKDIFERTTRKIVVHLKQVIHKETDTIIMVGGFSESPMLFEAVKESFKDKKVILPEEAGLSVLKGAVLFGHKSDDIRTRVSPYTYGYKVRNLYDPAKHDKSHMYLDDIGTQWVKGVFSKLIQIKEKIPLDGETQRQSVYPIGKNTSFSLKLFASTDPDPMYVDDPSCFEVGRVVVDCRDDDGNVGGADISLKFGGTEVEARAVLKSNGRLTTTTFDFLD